MYTDPYGAYRPPPPPPPVPARAARSKQVAVAVLGALALVGAGAATGAAVFDSGPIYPARWDSRVADIVTFVEKARGHRFKHPVSIYFLSESRYSDIAGGGVDRPAPSAEDRHAAGQSVAEYRAMGLMEGAPDLLAADEKLQDSGTLAFYSPEDDVVNVRGTKMTVGLRVTLAHELTHALQDQYFDLGPVGTAPTADAQGAARSIVEGDATSVENAYIDALSEHDRTEYDAESHRDSSSANDELGDVPDVLQVLFGSYYAVGSAFVDFWQAAPNAPAKLPAIDAVLDRLPSSSSQLFEPTTYLARATPKDVHLSGDTTSSDVFEVSTFGVDYLYVMLAERIDPHVALAATDGWVGDAYRASTETGTMCVSAKVRFATHDDANQFQLAIEAWSKTMPARAKVRSNSSGSTATFETCDPGKDANVGLTGKAGPALAFPVTRLQVAAQAVAGGRSRQQALCYGNAVISHLTEADLQASERTPAIDAAISAAETACP